LQASQLPIWVRKQLQARGEVAWCMGESCCARCWQQGCVVQRAQGPQLKGGYEEVGCKLSNVAAAAGKHRRLATVGAGLLVQAAH